MGDPATTPLLPVDGCGETAPEPGVHLRAPEGNDTLLQRERDGFDRLTVAIWTKAGA